MAGGTELRYAMIHKSEMKLGLEVLILVYSKDKLWCFKVL